MKTGIRNRDIQLTQKWFLCGTDYVHNLILLIGLMFGFIDNLFVRDIYRSCWEAQVIKVFERKGVLLFD